jgi:hypothetical protein
MLDVLMGNVDPFLIEYALVASDEPEHLSVVSQQTQNDIMSAWTLPTVETHSDSYLSRLTAFLESDYLVALLGNKGVLMLHSCFQFLCNKLEFLTKDQGGIFVKDWRVLYLLS